MVIERRLRGGKVQSRIARIEVNEAVTVRVAASAHVVPFGHVHLARLPQFVLKLRFFLLQVRDFLLQFTLLLLIGGVDSRFLVFAWVQLEKVFFQLVKPVVENALLFCRSSSC